MNDKDLIDDLGVTSVATGRKLTYDDLLKAHDSMGKMEVGTPMLVYHPSIICRAIEEGAMREDEDGRVWTVIPSVPPAHNIEVFASEEVDETKGFYIEDEKALYVGKR